MVRRPRELPASDHVRASRAIDHFPDHMHEGELFDNDHYGSMTRSTSGLRARRISGAAASRRQRNRRPRGWSGFLRRSTASRDRRVWLNESLEYSTSIPDGRRLRRRAGRGRSDSRRLDLAPLVQHESRRPSQAVPRLLRGDAGLLPQHRLVARHARPTGGNVVRGDVGGARRQPPGRVRSGHGDSWSRRAGR